MKLETIAKPIRIRLSFSDKREFASLESLKQSFDLGEVRDLLKGDSMIRWLKQNGEASLCKKIEARRKNPDKIEDDEIIDMFFGCDDPHDRKYVASMKELGFIYWEAEYTAQNNDKAIASFRKAKNAGDFEGEALMYIVENESGDKRSGEKLISLARDKRFAHLSRSVQGRVYKAIGDYYQFEKKDYKSAILNYTNATDKGWDCDMALALLYHNQLYDYDKALEYLRKCFISSLEENDEDDIYSISGMLPSWMVATGKCSYEEIVNAYKDAVRYGHADACFELGYFFLQGERGCTQDYKEAISFFNNAIELNDKEAGVRYYLALCYLNGYGVDKDVNRAIQLLEEEIGLSNGQYSNWAKDRLKEIFGTTSSKENYTEDELKAFNNFLRRKYKGNISRFCLFSQATAYHIPQSLALEIAKEYKIKIV